MYFAAVFMLYISMGKITGGTPPILMDDPYGAGEGLGGAEGGQGGAEAGLGGAEAVGEAVAEVVYSNPLPHVLILTAIVVGIATTSVGLALAVRIKEAYGTMEEDEINRIEAEAEAGE